MRIQAIAITILAVLTQPVASQSTLSSADAVRAADQAQLKTCVEKNLTGFVAFWETSGSVLAPNVPIATGPQAVRAYFAPFFALPNLHCSWQPLKVEAARSGELGYSTGTYQNSYDDPQGKRIEDRGKYATIWRKQSDGSWRIVLDTFSSDLPAPRN